MNLFRNRARVLAATTLLALLPATGAWAQAVDGALERLKALVAEQGAEISWSDAQVNGADVTLVGVQVGAAGDSVPVGDVELTGIAQTADGYTIEEAAIGRYFVDDGDGSSLSVEGVSMTGLVLPNEGVKDEFGGFLFYETADVGSVNVRTQGKDVFSMTDLHFELTRPEGGNPMEFTGAAEGFTVDLSVIEDPQQIAVLEQLGYLQLDGYFEMAGSWQPQDGRMELSQYDLTVVDAGTLGLAFDIGGYTPDFIAALREIQQQMAANPDGDTSAQGLAIMGLMQQLTFHGADITFADDSLTNKVIEFVAQMQGMKPADIKNQAKAVVPFALAQLNNPDLTTKATQAVSAFIDDPKTLRISAEPADAVPFALIMAAAMSNPLDLTRTLAVAVYANE